MHQRTHRPTITMHSDWHATPPTRATTRHPLQTRPYLAHAVHVVGNILRYLARHPVVALTIALALVLLVGTIGEAQAAAQIDAQIAQTRAQNTHISQQITQTNALIAQLSQDSAIIAAALKLGDVMPTGASGAQP